MTKLRQKLSSPRRAFTLVELLVVIGIIGLVATLIVPSVGPLLSGSTLTQGAQTVNDRLNVARQTALSKNRLVEVRFYRYGDIDVPGEDPNNPKSGHFRAFQLFELIPPVANGTDWTQQALSKVETMPAGVILDSSNQLSSLLNQSKRRVQSATVLKPAVSIPRIGTNYEFVSMRFRPDGSTDLPADESGGWFVTLHNSNFGDSLSTPPPNFATVQIDPVNGNLRIFRP